MVKITVGIEGMACGMCETHLGEAVRNAFQVKKVTSSHTKKAFLYGALSGAVEPVGAALTILAAGFVVPFLPYLLSFAAGAMFMWLWRN